MRTITTAVVGLVLGLFSMASGWRVWVALLVLLNVVLPTFFLPRPQAIWTLAAISGSFVIMVVLFAHYGFVRLLGLGHLVAWTPLIPYLWLSRSGTAEPFEIWLTTVVAVNTASWLIDLTDVARFLAGDHEPTA